MDSRLRGSDAFWLIRRNQPLNQRLCAFAGVTRRRGLGFLAVLAANLFLVFAVHAQTVPQSQEQVRLSFAPVVREAAPAVVNIYTQTVVRTQRVSPLFNDPFFRQFFGEGFPIPGIPEERVQNSLGSGVLVRADGVVVTNHHVVAGADQITVMLSDRREFSADLLGSDPRTDLAVLRLREAPNSLPTIPFGEAERLEVGDLVLAIGNPFGVGQTVTSGIVSALARTSVGITDFRSFIQTDAAINPGNSGGALVALDGTLVGINTAIFSQSGGSLGIGFAIPADMVEAVVASILETGRVVRPWLGLQGQPVESEIAASLGMDRPGGVLINGVAANGPAARAGLRVGDLVVAVNGRTVFDDQELRYRLATLRPGQRATFRILRNRQQQDVEVALVPPPEDPPRQETTLSGQNPLTGTVVANLNPALAEDLGLGHHEGAVVVLEVPARSYAARIGVQRGDFILGVNGRETGSVQALVAALGSQPQPRWDVTVQRGERVMTFRVN